MARAVLKAEEAGQAALDAALRSGRRSPSKALRAADRAFWASIVDEQGHSRPSVEAFLRWTQVAPRVTEAQIEAFAAANRAIDEGASQTQALKRYAKVLSREAARRGVSGAEMKEFFEARSEQSERHRHVTSYSGAVLAPGSPRWNWPLERLRFASLEPGSEPTRHPGDDGRDSEQRWRRELEDSAAFWDEFAVRPIAQDLGVLAEAISQYPETMPELHGGGRDNWVKVYAVRQPHSTTLHEIWARHSDGRRRLLVPMHIPSIVFPRVTPDGYALEPSRGWSLAYSFQPPASGRGPVVRIVDTRSGEEIGPTIPGAWFVSMAWMSPDRLAIAYGSIQDRKVDVVNVTTGRIVTLVPPRSTIPWQLRNDIRLDWYDVLGGGAGAHGEYVAVGISGGNKGGSHILAVLDASAPGPPYILHEAADNALTQVKFLGDGRLYALSWDAQEWPRGVIAEVPLAAQRGTYLPDDPTKRFAGLRRDARPHTWKTLSPHARDPDVVLRDFALVDRGPDRQPLLVIGKTLHNVVQAELFDPETGQSTELDMRGMGPPVHRPDGSLVPGVFGDLTGMSVTKDRQRRDVVEIAHSSAVSAPVTMGFTLEDGQVIDRAPVVRTRDDGQHPPAATFDTLMSDPSGATPKVTLHEFAASDGHPVTGFLVEHPDTPGEGPLLNTMYQSFGLGPNKGAKHNSVPSLHYAAGGRLWFSEGRGTGAEGRDHHFAGARGRRFDAVRDGVAAIRYLVKTGIARRGEIALSVQSAGPLVGVRVAYLAARDIGYLVVRRNVTSTWDQLAQVDINFLEHIRLDPLGVLEAEEISSGTLVRGMRGPRHQLVIGSGDDPRVPQGSSADYFTMVMRTLTQARLLLKRTGGHFPGAEEAALELAYHRTVMHQPLPAYVRRRAEELRSQGADSAVDPAVDPAVNPTVNRAVSAVVRNANLAALMPRIGAAWGKAADAGRTVGRGPRSLTYTAPSRDLAIARTSDRGHELRPH